MNSPARRDRLRIREAGFSKIGKKDVLFHRNVNLGLGDIIVLEGFYIVRSIRVPVLKESDLVCGLGRFLTIELSEVRYRRM